MVFEHSRRYIPHELIGIFKYFNVNNILSYKDHSISVDQARYTTSIVDNYLDTATVNKTTKFYKTTFTSDIIFTKAHASIRDEQVEKLTW